MPNQRRNENIFTGPVIAKKVKEPVNVRAMELLEVANGVAINENAVRRVLMGEGYSRYVAEQAVTFARRMASPEIVSNTMNAVDAAAWLKEELGITFSQGYIDLTHKLALGVIPATADLRTTPEALREWAENRRGPGNKMATLYIFDLVGTLVKPIKKPVKGITDVEFLPGVETMSRYLRDRRCDLAIASNQGGVAYGHLTFEQAEQLIKDVCKTLDIGQWRMCPHHPDGTVKEYSKSCRCRKPKPNMIKSIREANAYYTWKGQFRPCVYVGDTEVDRQTAENAGVEFVWAKEFFRKFVTKA